MHELRELHGCKPSPEKKSTSSGKDPGQRTVCFVNNHFVFSYRVIELMKSYLKSELARAAGVSCSTFKRWLRQQSEMFCQWGVTPRTQLLPPVAVQWICKAYGIDEGEL